MSHPGVRNSRRSLLRSVFTAAAAAPLLSACDLLDGDPPAPPPPDPLTEFYAETISLINNYDTAIVAAPASAILVTIRDAHKAHLAALAAIMKPAPSGTPQPPASAAPAANLRQAEAQAQQSAITACMTAAPARVTLLGEIAAARACHLEVLP